MEIQLSDHFTYKRIIRFCAPPILMMVFTSIYGVVDGLFVSNFVGKIPFAAINLIMPAIWVLDGIWWAITVGEVLACAVSGAFLAAKKEKYHYL